MLSCAPTPCCRDTYMSLPRLKTQAIDRGRDRHRRFNSGRGLLSESILPKTGLIAHRPSVPETEEVTSLLCRNCLESEKCSLVFEHATCKGFVNSARVPLG